MNLNTKDWKEFVLGDLFTIKKGKRLTAEDQEDGNNNYIGAIDSNNGIANHIAQAPIHKGNTISLSYNGSVGEAFYQKDPYWATDDVNALYSKYHGFNEPIGLFLATILRQEKYKFSYGRKWTLDNMNDTIIKLPIKRDEYGNPIIDDSKKYSDDGYVPDWKWMEDYIETLHHEPLKTRNKLSGVSKLNVKEWKEFSLNQLFTIDRGKESAPNQNEEGDCILINETEDNNGFVRKVTPTKVFTGNAITVSINFGENVFYQPEDFCASVNIAILRNDEICTASGLFIVSVLREENKKYGYGYKTSNDRIKDTILKLPILCDADGTPIIDDTHKYSEQGYIPDWQWMENYIKTLPYGDRI